MNDDLERYRLVSIDGRSELLGHHATAEALSMYGDNPLAKLRHATSRSIFAEALQYLSPGVILNDKLQDWALARLARSVATHIPTILDPQVTPENMREQARRRLFIKAEATLLFLMMEVGHRVDNEERDSFAELIDKLRTILTTFPST